MSTKIIKDETNFLIFREIYLRFDEPGAKRKAFAILEAAVECLDKKGFQGITLEFVARKIGGSRQSIKYYFASLDDLTDTAIKYVRLQFQHMVVTAVAAQPTEEKKLEAYIDACFGWVDSNRTHANVWLSFLNLCVRKTKLRELNTLAVEAGEDRIRALLEFGKNQGRFSFDSAADTAKVIQSLVTGSMITYASENLKDAQAYRRVIRQHCLATAGVRIPAPTR